MDLWVVGSIVKALKAGCGDVYDRQYGGPVTDILWFHPPCAE